MPIELYKISEDDELLRRVKLPVPPNSQTDLIKILPNGQKEVTRLAFRPDPKRDKDGLSVNVVKLVSNLEDIYRADSHILVKISASIPINLGCDCIHDPLPNDNSHALIKNLMGEKEKQVKLAQGCQPI